MFLKVVMITSAQIGRQVKNIMDCSDAINCIYNRSILWYKCQPEIKQAHVNWLVVAARLFNGPSRKYSIGSYIQM